MELQVKRHDNKGAELNEEETEMQESTNKDDEPPVDQVGPWMFSFD